MTTMSPDAPGMGGPVRLPKFRWLRRLFRRRPKAPAVLVLLCQWCDDSKRKPHRPCFGAYCQCECSRRTF